MLILRRVLDMQVKMKGYSICESGTGTGYVAGVISIPMASKGTRDGRWWSAHRPEREEGLEPCGI